MQRAPYTDEQAAKEQAEGGQADEQQVDGERRYRLLADNSTDIITLSDPAGVCRYVSPAVRSILGWEPGELAGRALVDFAHADDRAALAARLAEAADEQAPRRTVWRMRAKNGRYVWLETVSRTIRDPVSGALLETQASSRDVTLRRMDEEALREAIGRFRAAFDHAPGGMALVTLDGRFLEVNQALCELLGYAEEELLACNVRSLVHPDDQDAGAGLRAELLAGNLPSYQMERRYLHADGHVVWALVSFSLVRDGEGRPLYLVNQVQDIGGRKRAEADLLHRALHDPLTGLPNRALFVDRLRLALAHSARRDSSVAVLFLDVDRLKSINDSLGHGAGDDLLVAVGQRVQEVLRPGDTVARLSGDEFTVLCEEVDDARDAERIAGRIARAIAAPLALDGTRVHPSASIGIALASGGEGPETLLRLADIAMYHAKQRGRARVELFDEAMETSVTRRLDIENGLHRALEHGELAVAYQPIVSLRAGTIVGVEALVRWHDPERGLVLPGDFIEVAEDCGLIIRIDTLVLEEACSRAAAWQALRPGLPPLKLAVNISSRQLASTGFAELVADVLARNGVDPGQLCLEVTESVMIEVAGWSQQTLATLRAIGVHLGIDDFGTGYSSLSYLKRLPADVLKMDRSFVTGLGSDPQDRAIVEAVIDLGRPLGLTTVAEGVETLEQLAHLRALGCDEAQGFLLARPQPAEEISALLAANPTF